MLTRDDLIDIVMSALAPAKASAAVRPGEKRNNVTPGTKFSVNGPSGRPFLSEWDIKKALTPGSTRLTLPGNSIVSPLALEWLALKGIELVRE